MHTLQRAHLVYTVGHWTFLQPCLKLILSNYEFLQHRNVHCISCVAPGLILHDGSPRAINPHKISVGSPSGRRQEM